MKGQNYIPEYLPLDGDTYNVSSYVGELLKATQRFTELKETINKSKVNADFLILPLLNQEAVSSTRIEGTQVTIDEIYEAQSADTEKNRNNQEALNYIDALDHGGLYVREHGKITKQLIKEMHVLLMSNGVRGENKTPGLFKTTENFIGSKGSKREHAEFIPPGPDLTEAYIDNLVEYMNSDIDDDKILIKIAIIHAQFETIHPFLDGNGRIGRVLIPLFLMCKKELGRPFFFISKTLEKNQFQYYQNLNQTRWEKNWDKWLSFFQLSVIKQCESTVELIKGVEELLDEDLDLLKQHHRHHQLEKYIQAVYANPIFTINKIAEATGISYQVCRDYTFTLFEQNRIYKNSMQRNTRYYNYRFLEKLR
ncbi:Fic family protein [Enterococcus casseliflavus]|uniref:Fic family protein n=1 Tax=Enterococcus casseliflavus TaxID=37734 RepID=UPI0035D87C1A